MQALNLPACDLQMRGIDGRPFVFDVVRKKYVALTPEEWVRQHMVHLLIDGLGYPASWMAIEKGFQYQGMARRADIVAHDRQGHPLVMVECKAPEVQVRQQTFDQAARYNTVVQAPFLAVTNGLIHYVCRIDREKQDYQFIESIPAFDTF